MHRLALLFGLLVPAASACATTDDDPADEVSDGKGDRSGGSRFDEVDPSYSTKTFREYVNKALDKLETHDSQLARLTLWSIESGFVKIDELRDLTCADFERVRADLPDAGLEPPDRATLHARNSAAAKAIENELDGYMWSNRIYVSRGQTAQRLAATLIHETNHVLNRSEVGYYDDLPTSAFIHEYRAFYAESLFDPEEYEGIDLVDYVIENYELDRSKIKPAILETPLTPRLLPDPKGWKLRNVRADREVLPDVCK